MTVHCPQGNDHLTHRQCPNCGRPQYQADNGTWVHCDIFGHCAENPGPRAADLVRQYDEQTGPKPGDPWDADVWAWHAAALLRTLGGNQ